MTLKPLLILLALATWAQAAGTVFTVTAYCPCRKCCGRWSGGPTASGRMPVAGVTIAAPRRIPLGTRLHLEGLGVRRVDDRLAPRFDARIDVYFPTHAQALRFGKRRLTVTQTPK